MSLSHYLSIGSMFKVKFRLWNTTSLTDSREVDEEYLSLL